MRNEKGQFISEGNVGRPKGSTNQRTTKLREKFFELVQANESTLHEDLKSLKPKERLDVVLQIASYLIPKLKSADLTVQDKTENKFQPIKIVIENPKEDAIE